MRSRQGDLIGGIALAHSQAAKFDVRDEQLLIGLASLTATATDSARLFREATELIVALAKSNQYLDQFAYVTSHDLRAPLRGIANLGQWIEEDLGDRMTDKSREYFQLLRGRVRRLEDLIQGVLAYSRAGRVAEPPADVDLHALVHDIVELLEPPPNAVITIQPSLPTLRTTRAPLQQVFMNLISNALKYNRGPIRTSRSAPCRLWTAGALRARQRSGHRTALPRSDLGLFQTLHSRDRIESTGIGLAIVRRIVEAHGGRA